MVAYYDKWILTAQRMLATKGSPVTWNSIRADGASTTPWKPATDKVTYEGVIVLLLPTSRYAYESFNIDPKTDLLQGYTVAYMAQQEFEPNIKDYFEFAGKRYTLENSRTFAPDSRSILHVMLVKND
jgi:hypothetical protein